MKGTLLWLMIKWSTTMIKNCHSSVLVQEREFVTCLTCRNFPHTQHTSRYLICSLKSDDRVTKCSTSREQPYVVSLAFIYILAVSLWDYNWTLPTRSVCWVATHIYYVTLVLKDIHSQWYWYQVETTHISILNNLRVDQSDYLPLYKWYCRCR